MTPPGATRSQPLELLALIHADLFGDSLPFGEGPLPVFGRRIWTAELYGRSLALQGRNQLGILGCLLDRLGPELDLGLRRALGSQVNYADA